MKRFYIGVGLLVFSAVVFWGVLTAESPTEILPEELAARVLQSAPKWADYQEDIKGHLGATPVARWRGEPVRARIDGADAIVIFEVSGVWATYDFALPVLLKDHLGNVYRNRSSIRIGSEVEYRFLLKDRVEGTSVPWIEVAYPHHFQRLALSPEGTWAAAG